MSLLHGRRLKERASILSEEVEEKIILVNAGSKREGEVGVGSLEERPWTILESLPVGWVDVDPEFLGFQKNSSFEKRGKLPGSIRPRSPRPAEREGGV